MRLLIKFILPLVFLSCSSRDIKISKFAKINDNNEYENNYINNEEKTISKIKFFNFFCDNIFSPPSKKKFPLLNINKKIYQKDVSLLTWSGHSTFLFQKHNVNILIDPHLTKRASPFRFIGPKRYVPSVFNKNNLYDHLDIKSLKLIYYKFPEVIFLVPLGDKKLLEQNGIKNVIELDWWETFRFESFKLIFTPVQHWSKRTFFDKNKSLWGGWWIESEDYKFLHLGDTGYSKDFIDIKNKLGKANMVAIPIGAYKPRYIMKNSHLNPKEALQTFVDIEAEKAVAMHWGTFILSQEKVDDPVFEINENLDNFGISKNRFLILKHGETIELD